MPYMPKQHPYHTQPFTPRFNIPETFREAVSYEGQIHYLANLCFDAYEWTEHHKSFYWHYSTQDFSDFIDLDTPDSYGMLFSIELDKPLYTWERPGDILAIRLPYEEDGEDAVIFAELLPANYDPLTEPETMESGYTWSGYPYPDHRTESYPYKVKCVWLYAVRDFSDVIDSIKDRLTDLEGRMTNVETRVTNVENRVDKLEQDVTNLTETVENLGDQINNLESKVTNLEQTVNNVGNTNEQLQKYIEAILNKMGGGTLNSDGSVTFTLPGTTAVGNINIYSQSDDPASNETNYLRTHTGLYDVDMWFNNEEV